MTTKPQDLAAVFAAIEKSAEHVEGVAAGILRAIKEAQAASLEQFNAMTADAYQRNGWSQKAGRPAADATERPAPDAVRIYVSTIRGAYRLGLDVPSFDTMGALRAAIRQARQAPAASGKRSRIPELRGVHLADSDSLNGALWHDAVVVWNHLPLEQRELFESQVQRLLARYTKQLHASPQQAAANR